MQKNRKKYVRFMGCLILTVLLLCSCKKESDLVIATGDTSDESLLQENDAPADEIREQPSIYVQVTGAVENPGVYELAADSRVFEAVKEAGGMTGDAAADCINQAEKLKDGDMIILYTVSQWEQVRAESENVRQSSQDEADGLVNINTADVAQLCTIPGIGESRAQSIVTYREQNGGFKTIEDIMKVSGIKDGLFQKIKDKIKV